MNTSQSRRRILAAGASGLLLGTSGARALSTREQSIGIGFSGGFGNKAQTNLSFSARDGALLAVEDANRRGLIIDGAPTRFTLMLADDQSEANFARIVANSFAAAAVSGVIGHNTTDSSIAAAPIYARAGIPMISPTSTGRILTTQGYKNVFQLLGHSEITAAYLADIITRDLSGRRVAILDNATALGLALADDTTAHLRSGSAQVVARESVNGKSSDFSAALARIKATDPDILFFTAVGPQALALTQNVRRIGLRATMLGTGGGVNLEFPRTGVYPEGTAMLLHGFPVNKRPGYADFERSYHTRYDSALTAYSMFSYDAVGMLIEAIRRLDSAKPPRLSEELHTFQYRGLSGPVAFAADGSQINPPYTLYRARRGQWQASRSYGE